MNTLPIEHSSRKFLLPFAKGDPYSTNDFDSLVIHDVPLVSGDYCIKGNNLLLRESKFFLLRVVQFDKGGKYINIRLISLKGVSF